MTEESQAQAEDDLAEEEGVSGLVRHIEAGIRSAEEDGMSASEVIGMLFYYAHNVAQEARESAIRQLNEIDG